MYEDDEELDQTKAPGMRGSDPAPEQRGAPMMQTMGAPGGGMGGGGDIRTMAAGGAMGGRQMPGQMPWQQGPQQGQPDWGSIVQRFRERFQQHNPFMGGGRFGGQPQGGPPPQGAPMPQPGAAPGGAPAPGPQGQNPWAARLAEAAQRFGGNRQPGGIMGGRGQY